MQTDGWSSLAIVVGLIATIAVVVAAIRKSRTLPQVSIDDKYDEKNQSMAVPKFFYVMFIVTGIVCVFGAIGIIGEAAGGRLINVAILSMISGLSLIASLLSLAAGAVLERLAKAATGVPIRPALAETMPTPTETGLRADRPRF